MKNFFIGGFTWDGESQLERFLTEGIWQNGYQDEEATKYQDVFKLIVPGDFFALKSTFVKGKGENAKSYLRIKAIGVVTGIVDSHTIKIVWDKNTQEFDLTDITWFAKTLCQITENDHINRIFGNTMKINDIDSIQKLLLHKKQIILQGPPGTGKTRLAKLIGQELTKDQKRFIQDYEVKKVLYPGLELGSYKESYPFKITNLDDSYIHYKILSTSTDYKVGYNKVIECIASGDLNKENGYKNYTGTTERACFSIALFVKENIDNSFVRIIQFHPSYSYEDFVRGIVVKANENNQVIYKTENKVITDIASCAKSDYFSADRVLNVLNNDIEIFDMLDKYKNYIRTVIDEGKSYNLGLTDMFIKGVRSEGIKFYYYSASPTGDGYLYSNEDIVKDYTEYVNNYNKLLEELSKKKQYLSVIQDFIEYIRNQKIKKYNTYVLIIDEINRANLPSVLGELIYALEYRGEAVESMYELDGDRKIVLPPNLYIIGTMNTADRSVGHIDYAIRRRFAFVDVLPEPSVITNSEAQRFYYKIEHLFDQYKASDFEKDAVMLGHSYFLAEDNATLKIKLLYEVLPILKEYAKDGVLTNSEDLKKELTILKSEIDAIEA